MLFSDIARSDDSSKRATETDFAFLDRCAWQSVGRIRNFIEACLEQYPSAERDELIARLRSGDARHFGSATFELFLHEYLLRLGCRLMLHPELQNASQRRPDFKVTCSDGQSLYLEAVSASDDDGRDPAGEARKAIALHILDSTSHPRFMVAIDSEGSPATQPSGRRLACEVVRWLDSLDADGLLSRLREKGLNSLPEMVWRHEDWAVRVRAIPIKAEMRGRDRRLIGIRNFGFGWIDGWTPIRKAVSTKTRRYGDLDLPLVVAVNVSTFTLDPIDAAQALFGEERCIFGGGDLDSEPRFERKPNGAWRGPAGPHGRRCSAAWLFDNVSPFTLRRRNHTLYVNPWAYRPVPESFLRMPRALVVDGSLKRIDGICLKDVFGLNDTWPE